MCWTFQKFCDKTQTFWTIKVSNWIMELKGLASTSKWTINLIDFNCHSFYWIKDGHSPWPARTSSACGPNNECWSTGDSGWPHPIRSAATFAPCAASPNPVTFESCVRLLSLYLCPAVGRPSLRWIPDCTITFATAAAAAVPATSNFLSRPVAANETAKMTDDITRWANGMARNTKFIP